jgi:hypothetical protein
VAAEERLIEQGVYTYAVDGQPTGIYERFSVYLRPDGARVTRVSRDARARFGATILLEAESAPPPRERDLCAFEVRLLNEGKGRMREVRARYTLTASSARVERSIDDDAPRAEVLALPAGVVVSPLMRVFLGPVIVTVAARGRGAEVPVLTPSLEDPEDESRVLFGVIDMRRAERLGDEVQVIAGREVATHVYRYLGKPYDDAASFWLMNGNDDLLVRYEMRQGGQVWSATLVEHRARVQGPDLSR